MLLYSLCFIHASVKVAGRKLAVYREGTMGLALALGLMVFANQGACPVVLGESGQIRCWSKWVQLHCAQWSLLPFPVAENLPSGLRPGRVTLVQREILWWDSRSCATPLSVVMGVAGGKGQASNTPHYPTCRFATADC